MFELFNSKTICVCSDERCSTHSGEIYNHIKQLLKNMDLNEEIGLQRFPCMRLCEGGPNIMVLPEGQVYFNMTKEKAEQIVYDLVKNK